MKTSKDVALALKGIETVIYTLPYDSLTPYLQGIRDMINLINVEEPPLEVAETIIRNFNECKENFNEWEDN